MKKKDFREIENYKEFTEQTDLRYSYPINNLRTMDDYLETADTQILNNHRLYENEKLTDLYILFLKLVADKRTDILKKSDEINCVNKSICKFDNDGLWLNIKELDALKAILDGFDLIREHADCSCYNEDQKYAEELGDEIFEIINKLSRGDK